MKNDTQNNKIFLIITGLIFALLNVVLFLASKKEVLPNIGNIALWGGFVALNTASILWVIDQLKVNALVIALAYLVGGALSFMGVHSLSGVGVVEVVTAGATYGALGALIASNFTRKIRLISVPMPFVVIILVILVLDGILNSQVLHSSLTVILNALVFPFIFAGVIIGLIWGILLRFGVGKPKEIVAKKPVVSEKKAPKGTSSKAAPKKVEKKVEKKVAPAPAKPAPVAEKKKVAPKPVVAKEKKAPVVEKKPTPVKPAPSPKKPEPKPEVKKPVETVSTPKPVEEKKNAPSGLPSLDSMPWASKTEEPKKSAPEPVKKPEVKKDDDFLSSLPDLSSLTGNKKKEEPVKEEPKKEDVVKEEVKKPESQSQDWLNDHLDFLTELKKKDK